MAYNAKGKNSLGVILKEHDMRNNQTGRFEPIDYIGQIFNGRKIIKRIPNATHNHTSKYIAECVICGKQVTRSMHTLKHGAPCDCQKVSIHEQRIGEIYGCMKIIEVLPHVKDKQRKYLCECVYCGEQSKYTVSDLKELKSLRCFHINNNRHRARDYTWKFPRLGGIYRGMFVRCYNKKAAGKHWKYYGGKGIEVCKEWQEFPEKFQEWALTHGYQDNLTIDRIDSNKDYCPENCQWITLAENVRRAGEITLEVKGNKSVNDEIVIKTYRENKNIAKVSRKLHIDQHTVLTVLRRNNIEKLDGVELLKEVMTREHGISVNMYSLDNQYLRTFSSITEAGRYMQENNLTKCKLSTISQHIREVCRGDRKTAAKYKWSYDYV